MVTAYTGATVLDGRYPMNMIPDATVLVEGGKIISIRQAGSVPIGAQTVCLDGKYLMPGLINLHCHLAGDGKPQTIDESTAKLIQSQLKSKMGCFVMKQMCASASKTELLSGTTTIRTVGGLGNIDSVIRDEINAGKRIGPRILSGNTAISVPGGHMAGTLAYISHSVDETVSLVHMIAKEKPDLIKLMITGGTLDIEKIGDENKVLMTPQQIRLACDAAHSHGLPVAAHIQGSEGIRIALENGVDTIEHGGDLDDSLIALFKDNNAALVSTITVAAVMACLPKEISGLSELYQQSCIALLESLISGYRKAVAAGVSIGMGLDNGSPYITQYCMWRELDFFCRYIGVSPEFSLHTATLKNAEILGLAGQIGSIESGKDADFLITNENPLLGFSTMAQPYMVVKQGKIFRKPKFKKHPKYDTLIDRVSQYDQKYRYGCNHE